MRIGLLAIPVYSLLLSGCDLLRLMLPHKAPTPLQAQQAIERCGISADSISWRVTEDGAFTFGTKLPSDRPLPFEKMDCLLKWASDERVKTYIIGWEAGEP